MLRTLEGFAGVGEGFIDPLWGRLFLWLQKNRLHVIMRDMDISFDPVKNRRNIRERGLSFDRAVDFDFESAAYFTDDRKDYGEVRWIAVGYLDRRLHVLCFVTTEYGIRIISFRKANAREVKRYGKAKTAD